MLKNFDIIMQTYWLSVSCELLLDEKMIVCFGGVKFVKVFVVRQVIKYPGKLSVKLSSCIFFA